MYDMNGRKTAVWEDALGQRIVFDNKTFFLESIDMTGTSGVNTVENLAFADGQKTIKRKLGAKTIPCSFSAPSTTWACRNCPTSPPAIYADCRIFNRLLSAGRACL